MKKATSGLKSLKFQAIDILHNHYYPTLHEQISDATFEECWGEINKLIIKRIRHIKQPNFDNYISTSDVGWALAIQAIKALLEER